MLKEHYLTYQEITSQGKALEKVYARLKEVPVDRSLYRQFLFTGCGSSFFLSQLIAYTWRRQLKVSCRAVPSSELILRPAAYLSEQVPTAVFAFSRTGSTTETIRACRLIGEMRDFSVFPVTCYGDSELAALGPRALVFPELQEQSLVMTRAFTGILGAFLRWAMDDAEELDQMPDRISRSLAAHQERVAGLARQTFQNVVFLGTGPFYPLACEAMLKVKEMTAQPSEAWQTFEFRHGPKAVLDDQTLIWLFAGREDAPYLEDALTDFLNLGAQICLTGNRVPPPLQAYGKAGFIFEWPVQQPETEALGLLHLPQLYAFFRAVQLGKNPDQPDKLSRVVKLT